MVKKLFLLLIIAGVCQAGWGQNSYIPYKGYDGEHKNEISAYAMGGNNVVTDGFGGLAASYTRHITPRWHVGGDGLPTQLSAQHTCPACHPAGVGGPSGP